MSKVIADGGDVQWTKSKGEVDTLWIQTSQIRNMIIRGNPRTFQLDTTFSTNTQGI